MKIQKIPYQLFETNRKRLYALLEKCSLVILHSNDEMNRTADQFFPFRQNSDLFYFCGIDQERTILLLAPDHRDQNMREILFIRKADKNLEIWEGQKLTIEDAQASSGIKNVKYIDDFESILAGQMIYANQVYLNTPEQPKFIPEIPCRNARYANELKSKYPAHTYYRLAPLMRKLRTIKSDIEINLIREACSITKDAFKRVLEFLKPGVMEYEVEAEIIHEFIVKGANGHAFQPIVASGINACSLHYDANNKQCQDGELLLLDFGADFRNYTADCSRTFPVNGRFTDRQRTVYETVLDVFKFARSLIKPGACINSVHDEVCKRFEKEHVKLGLYTRQDLDHQDNKSPLYQKYYMHGTSHFMGLDVHDPGDKDAVFKPGMVLTCEPGIYIPEEKLGIRIENDILITGNGNEDLMEDIPIEVKDLERLL
ncbi:MAG: aminopeptidase P N-terminal domain-containing protein [Bacteroidales bacterium]|nr:aminopeptidase P N-terminal domain-containing protein [Bacteroidales bacterium]